MTPHLRITIVTILAGTILFWTLVYNFVHDQVVRLTDGACRIEGDGGGSVWRFNPYSSCRKITVYGVCASQCTIDLFRVRGRVCVTPGAQLWFHKASDPTGIRFDLTGWYPADVQAYILKRGGLRADLWSVRGDELVHDNLLRAC